MVVVLEHGAAPVPSLTCPGSMTPVRVPTSGLVAVVIVGDLEVYDVGMGGTGGGVQASLSLTAFLSSSGERILVNGRNLGFTSSGTELVSAVCGLKAGDLDLRLARDPCDAPAL